ncbi:Detected protein of unknown function [Hibiscus syriacus]|uniref:DUF674 family protein n=1 Tax=Hibiscus syriacus TaxID=106335 RepID=A0A6A2X6E8_HIBSY|nr:Detected protein of unknown function [Hibiscus syriacus]
MASKASTAAAVSLKLLIDSKGQRVLYAEAGKDFVDFLFNILLMPVGTVTRLLTKQGMIGCLGNLYQSVENLGDAYIQPTKNRDTLLKPTYSSNLATNVSTASSAANEGGYVKGVVTYTILDDLTVTPMSTISSITMLNKFNVKQVDALEEKVVNVGMNEGVELLKASMQSKTVLSDVFLSPKAGKKRSN